jgi:proteasome assembly chaperone (PAC2) family protein
MDFLVKKPKVNILYSIGATLRSSNPAESKLFGVTSSTNLTNLLKKQKIELLNGKGQITGFNGLVFGIAKEKRKKFMEQQMNYMDAACLS